MRPEHVVEVPVRKEAVMKRLILTTCVLLGWSLAGSAVARGTGGTWTAYAKENGSEQVQFSLQVEPKGNMGMGFDLSAFDGLTWEPASRSRSAAHSFIP
jgi:hypothetical protein